MMLKASIAVITLAIGMSAGAPARAETGCQAAHRTAHHPARRAATSTVIVEEHYSHAPRAPAPPYNDEPGAPPEAYAPPPADIAYGAPDDYYEPILTSYGYGYPYGGYGGYGYRRPYSGWFRHTGGGANWMRNHGVFVSRGPGVGGQVAFAGRGVGVGGRSVGVRSVGGRGGVMAGGVGRGR